MPPVRGTGRTQRNGSAVSVPFLQGDLLSRGAQLFSLYAAPQCPRKPGVGVFSLLAVQRHAFFLLVFGHPEPVSGCQSAGRAIDTFSPIGRSSQSGHEAALCQPGDPGVVHQTHPSLSSSNGNVSHPFQPQNARTDSSSKPHR